MFSAKTIAAAVVALPFLFQSAIAGPCVRDYTIQAGDICDSISAAKNVSTYQLATINAGVIDSGCGNLAPGNKICLGYEGEDCSTTYIVVKDDTCEGIQSKSGVNSTILRENNPQINEECSNIYIGEVLCTANQVQVPPAPGGKPVPAGIIPATATAAIPTSTPAVAPAPVTAAVEATTTPAAVTSSSKAPEPTSTDDDDDESLPYCDEL